MRSNPNENGSHDDCIFISMQVKLLCVRTTHLWANDTRRLRSMSRSRSG